MINSILYDFAVGIVALHISIVFYILIAGGDFFFKTSFLKKIKNTVRAHAYTLFFFHTLFAALGSLFLSEVAKIPPCVLCWYQRIALYPQVILSYLALLRGETITPYLLSLNVVGAFIAAYHYLIQRFPQASILNCESVGASCTSVSFLYFGYITIPLMGLTVFVINIILLSFAKKNT